MIVSKSLHHSNIAVLLNDSSFIMPESSDFMALYRGEEAKGARLIDDYVLGAKVLTLPVIKSRITLEKSRFRVDDESGTELKDSRLTKDVRLAYDSLFRNCPINSWGINLDIYFRTRNVIPLNELFSPFFNEEALSGADLLDTGIQFTLKKKDYVEVWFLKVTAPLEIAVHVNRHFNTSNLPDEKTMRETLNRCYNETDSVMSQFILG